MTHTPGPWNVLSNSNQIWCADYPVAEVTCGVWGDDYPSLRLVGPSLQIKAEAYMDRIAHGEVFKETAESNACLIAAAPDLLEALKKIANPPVVVEGDRPFEVISWAAEIAKQAIAKAEGK